MKLICEVLEETAVHTIVEDVGGKKSMFITGPFLQAEQKNRNNRIYPAQTMEREVNRYIKEYVEKNRAIGELNHPPTPNVNPERACIKIESLVREGNDWIGKAKVTSTPMGQIVRGLLEDGVQLGVSTRGMGSLKNDGNGTMIVQEDFRLATAADVVMDPSAPSAFVNGIMEGVDWVWNNGILVQQDLEETRKNINYASKSRNSKALTEARLNAWKLLTKSL
jgi:hypothetical protein